MPGLTGRKAALPASVVFGFRKGFAQTPGHILPFNFPHLIFHRNCFGLGRSIRESESVNPPERHTIVTLRRHVCNLCFLSFIDEQDFPLARLSGLESRWVGCDRIVTLTSRCRWRQAN